MPSPRPSSRAEPARGHGHLEPAGPQSPCSHGIWCSTRMRARALGELRPPDPHVLVRLAIKRRPRGRGDSRVFRSLRRRNPHVPTPKWCRPRRRAKARAGARAWGLPKGRGPDPPQNLRNKPIFHFDGAPFSKTGELNAPDPSRSQVLSTSGPEKRGFARDTQKTSSDTIGQRRTRMLLRLN